MKNSINLTKYSVFFPKDPVFGNPAAVIETSNQESSELQALARELNMPVTVFLFGRGQGPAPTIDDQKIPKIRFFYPNRETSICVHGALAVACHLLKNEKSIQVINRDNTSLLLSKGETHQSQYFINLTPTEMKNKLFNIKEVLAMLAINELDIDLSLPFEISSVRVAQNCLFPLKT